MGHHVGDAFQFWLGRGSRIYQQEHFAKGDGAQVLHGPGREIGQCQQVQLVARIGNVVVLGEVPQGECADVEGELREVGHARAVDHTQRHAIHVDWLGGFQLTHHETHQIGGHLHGVAEVDRAFT